ncbi:hypothetical protein GCM10022393_00640 [Aquimarina addita]|uniref:Cytochrome c domain-containing protein n=1 Tax=Aquimarina addita TaxID=870485 RepID=A0ABP7X7G2_9FLAO
MKKHVKKLILLEAIVFLSCLSLLTGQEAHKNNSTEYTSLYQDTELSKSIARGSEIYTDFCMQCHLPDGKGTPKVIPPLAGSDWLVTKRQESIHSIKYGLQGPIKVNGQSFNSAMSSLGLEDEEIADVMNYIMSNWGNTQEKMVTTEEVTAVEK